MVICETSEQARKLFAYFDEIQAELNKDASMKSHLRAGPVSYTHLDVYKRQILSSLIGKATVQQTTLVL